MAADKIYNITLTANHQTLTAEYLPLAAESVQYLTAKVVCETEDWTGREIKAMFGQGCTVHEITVIGGEITAKQQLNLSAGDWCVWLVGNSARDGEVIPRITTNIAHISVAPTGGTEGNPFPTIPPTAEEQLRADMGDLADLTTKDKSNLVAAINEAAASGGSKDAVTYTPQTLTDEQQKQARTNIGAVGQPVFAVNVTATEDDNYTADKTAAEIEAAYQAGHTIVCRMNWLFGGRAMPIELPLKSRTQERVFLFALDQLSGKDISSLLVQISDSGITFGPQNATIYEKPDAGIPKSDLAADVRTSLDNAMQQDGGIYSSYIKAATKRGVMLLQDEIRVGGLGTGNCVNITKTKIGIYGASGALGLYADASRIHNLVTPSADTDAANKQYVDAAKTEAQQLGLTAATPGQIIKVKTVQDGKPTEWEAVDMPGGGSGETWGKVADVTLTDNVNSMRVTFDACSAVYVQLQWGGVAGDLGKIWIVPNSGDTPDTSEGRVAAAAITTSEKQKRGYSFVAIDTRKGSVWTAISYGATRDDGVFGEISPDNFMNCDIRFFDSFSFSLINNYYFTISNEPLSNGVTAITVCGAGMAIGTTLRVWGIKK